MVSPNVGAKRYLVMGTESSWGTLPGTPYYVHVPVDDYTVKLAPVNRQNNPFSGLLQRMHSRNIKGMPAGNIPVMLYGFHPTNLTGANGNPNQSLAEWLMTWAFANHETLDLPSKFAEWYRGPNVANCRHLGLRVDQVTLAGSEDSPITMQIGVQGKTEVGDSVVTSAQALVDDRDRLVEFLFENSVLELNGSEIPIGGFSRQLQRGLKAKYYNSTAPQVLRATQYVETLSITKPKDDDAWADVIRSLDPEDAHTATLTLKGLHMGTGGSGDYAQAEIVWPLMSLVTHEMQGGRDDLEDDVLNFVCLKPDTSSNTHTTTWSEV